MRTKFIFCLILFAIIACLKSNETKAQPYYQTVSTYSPFYGSGTPLNLSYNNTSAAIPIGFNFKFYGQDFTQVYVSSSGFLSFDYLTDAGCCSGQSLPNANFPNIISWCWSNMDPYYGFSEYFTTGAAPNRIFVINYTAFNYVNYNWSTVQVSLHETSNEIKIQSDVNDMTDPYNYSVGATMGLNKDGITSDVVIGRNATAWYATNECITFDTYQPSTGDDIGIVGFSTPTLPYVVGYQLITATIFNYGNTTITSADIDYTIDGIPQTQVNWTGSLAPGQAEDVGIAYYYFYGGEVVSATVSNPNLTTDVNAANDTYSQTYIIRLNGTYGIGVSPYDYPDIATAVADLELKGVSGPVTFQLGANYYYEQISITPFFGMGAANPVKFESESGDANDVHIYFNNTALDMAIVKLDGVNHITFKNISIQGNNYDSLALVQLLNNAADITIKGCSLNGGSYYYSNAILAYATSISGLNIDNCNFSNVSHGLYFSGSNSFNTNNISITNCSFNNVNDVAISMDGYYSNSSISGNTFTSNYGTYDMYLANSGEGISITKNKFDENGPIMISLLNCNGTSLNKNIVANNFFNGGIYSGSEMYAQDCNYLAIANNTFNLQNTNIYNAPLILTNGSSIELLNNIFSNAGGGRCLTAYYGIPNYTADHNDYYTTGSVLADFDYVSVGNLSQLQSASGQDASSISANPVFVSASNLHVNSFELNAAAIPLSYVTDDIDGDVRNVSTPDIGADEFNLPDNDAGVIGLASPAKPFIAGNYDVIIQLKNFGGIPLTSAIIDWTLNGIPQTPVNFSGSIAPGTNASFTLATAITFNASTPYIITATSSNPNGAIDANNLNDSYSSGTLQSALCGVYNVGGAAPDFVTMTDANTALINGGISCAVTFNIRTGSYPETFTIKEIAGTSSLNTITFQSEILNANAVVLADNENLITIDGADYLTFNKVMFRSTSSNSFAVNLTNTSLHNSFTNCKWNSPVGASNTFDYLNINNCQFIGVGIGLTGSANDPSDHVVIDQNTFTNLNTSAINANGWIDGIQITSNTITNVNIGQVGAGLYLFDLSGNYLIDKNRITGCTGYGIVIYGCSTVSGFGRLSNNFVQTIGTEDLRALLLNYSSQVEVFNNSLNSTNLTPTNFTFRCLNSDNLNIQNNIIANTGGGYAVSFVNTYANIISDYNDYYITGAKLSQYENVDKITLADFQTATNRDAHSVTINPGFVSSTNLHATSILMNNSGTPLSVLDDIDGDVRSVSTPDMGADEFTPPANNIAAIAVTSPAPPFSMGMQPITIRVFNYGSNTVTAFDLTAIINGVALPVYSWTGSFAASSTADVTIGNFNFTSLIQDTIVAYTSMPNGSADSYPANDTTSIIVRPSLCGVYTIGGTSPDYATIEDAITALDTFGVSCNVVFNIRPNVYPNTYTIKNVFGASPSATITFQSETGNAADVTFTSAADAIVLNGANYIRLNKLAFNNLNFGWTYHSVFCTVSSNRYIQIDSCQFTGGSTDNPNANEQAITFYNVNDMTGLQIRHCNFTGFKDAINLYGLSNLQNDNIEISDNIFTNNKGNGIVGIKLKNISILKNEITTKSVVQGYGSHSTHAIDLNQVAQFTIDKNKVSSEGYYNGNAIPIYIYAAGNAINQSVIKNNFVTLNGQNYNVGGITISNSNNIGVYHNSIYTRCYSALYFGGGSNLDIRNNIFMNTNSGYALYIYSPGSVYVLDNNDYKTNNPNYFCALNGTNANSLAAWKTLFGQDVHSLSVDPLFASITDYHISQVALFLAGANVGVADDIDGQTRNSNTPDIGADERVGHDIAITALTPVSGCLLSNAATVTITLQNNGVSDETGFIVSYILDGGTTFTETYTGTLLAGTSANFSFATLADVSAAGNHSFVATATLVGDANPANNTIHPTISNTIINASPNQTICSNTNVSSVYLFADYNYYYHYLWSTGSTDSYIVSAPIATTTYTVTVTTGTCTATLSSTVFVSDPPTITINASATSLCLNASATLTANATGTPAHYLWSNGNTNAAINVTPLTTTTFTVSVTDANGCSASASQLINVETAQITPPGAVQICQASSVDLVATAGASYLWNNGSTNQSVHVTGGGTYTVTITFASGCSATVSSVVTQINAVNPNASIVPAATVVTCPGNNVILTAGGGLNYLWSTGSVSQVLTINPNVSATYTVTVTSNAGCTATQSRFVDVSGSPPTLTFSGNPNYTSHIVDPLLANPYHVFRFEIKYTDVDGDLPAIGYPKVYLDYENNASFTDIKDRIFTMQPADLNDNDVTDGKIYFCNATGLTTGINYHSKVIVQDVHGCDAATTLYDEPDVLDDADLYLFANDIVFSVQHPDTCQAMTVSATIHNNSDYAANNFVVHLVNQAFPLTVFPDITTSLGAHSQATVSWNISAPCTPSWNPMQVFVDYTNILTEPNELDNQAIRPFVCGPFNVPGSINVYPNISPASAYKGTAITLSGNAYYSGTAVPLVDSSCAGATVIFTVVENAKTFSGYTNSAGYFSFSIPTDSLPIGLYHITGSCTDYTLTGNFTSSFVLNIPPCYKDISANLTFRAGILFVGDTMSGYGTILNSGCDTISVSTLSEFTISPGAAPIPASTVVSPLNPGQSIKIPIPPITFNTAGSTTISLKADAQASIVDDADPNNNTVYSYIQVYNKYVEIHPYIPLGGYQWNSAVECNTSLLPFMITNDGTQPTGNFTTTIEIFDGLTSIGIYPYTVNVPAGYNYAAGGYWQSTSTIYLPFTPPHAGNFTFTINCDVPFPNGIVAESNETNNEQTGVLIVHSCGIPTGLPDLQVSVNSIIPIDPVQGGTIEINATISNTHPNGTAGSTVAGPIVSSFLVNGVTYNHTYSGSLADGQSANITITGIPTPPFGCNTVVATVDAPNSFAERFENNNSEEDSMEWNFSLNDLYKYCPSPKTKMWWEDIHVINQPFTVNVGLFKSGLYDASLVNVRFEVSGPGITGWMDLGITSVTNVYTNIGYCTGYDALLSSLVSFPLAGTYYMRMSADENNAYAECDEVNNILIVPFIITDKPDYRVFSQYIAPSLLNPNINEPITIFGTYDNAGVTGTDSIKMKFIVDNDTLSSVKTKGLNNGDSYTDSMPGTWSSNLPGAHIIRIIIDADSTVAEANELNNEATRAIVVGHLPDFSFDTLYSDNPNPSPQVAFVTVYAVVRNNGDSPCETNVKLSYINDLGATVFVSQVHVNIPANSTVPVSWQYPSSVDNNTTLIAKIDSLSSTCTEARYDNNSRSIQLGILALTPTSTPISCIGSTNGTATIAVNGGVSPYTYFWSNGNTNNTVTVGGGTYTVTVFDSGGNTASVGVVVGVAPDNINPLIYNLPSNINVTASDGVCPHPVSWSAPLASDNCSVISLTSNYQPGDLFPSGTTQVKYTATDAAGNKDVKSFNVVVTSKPLVLAQNPAFTIPKACNGTTQLHAYPLAYGTGIWSVQSGSGTFADVNDPNTMVTNASTSTNIYRWNFTNGTCTTAYDSVIVTDTCHATITASGDTTFCSGNSVTLSASTGTSYLWSTGATTQAITASVMGTYTVIIGISGGGTTDASVLITVLPLPVPSITIPSILCEQTAFSLSASGGSSYLWSTGSTAVSINQTINSAATYTITVTAANGCTASTSAVITPNSKPTPNISGATSFCPGSSTTLDAGSGYTFYNWSNGASTQTFSVNTVGTFTVTVTNSNGCSGTANVTTTLNPNLAPSISGGLSICAGSSTTLDVGNGYTSYNWSNGATTQTISVSAATTYTVTVTNANGCTGSVSAVINLETVPPVFAACPVATIDLGCNPVTLPNAAAAVIAAGSVSDNCTVASVIAVSNGITGSCTKTETYTVTATDNAGNTAQCSVTYHWKDDTQIPVITAANSNSNIGSNPSGAAIEAALGTATALDNCDGNLTSSLSVITGAPVNTSGSNWTVTRIWNVTDACTNAAIQVSVTVNYSLSSQFTVSALITNVLCKGNKTGAITVTVSGGSNVSYLWSNGKTTASLTNVFARKFKLTVTDIYQTKVFKFTVTEPATGILLTGTTKNPKCNTGATGTATVAVSGGSSPYSYLWTNGQTNSTATGLAGGAYIVTVTDGGACTRSMTFMVVAPAALSVSLAATNPTVALPNSGQIIATVSGGTPNYVYLWNTSPLKTTATITGLKAGAYMVKVTDKNTCTTTASVALTNTPARFANAKDEDMLSIAVMPNPNDGLFTIKVASISESKALIELLDITGRVVLTQNMQLIVGDNAVLLDAQTMAKGVYFLRFTAGDKSRTLRIIIE